MTVYKTPRLRLTPAEERAADVMEWVHNRLWQGLYVPDASCLAAVALLEQVAFCPEWSVLAADDPMRLDMHDDEEGER